MKHSISFLSIALLATASMIWADDDDRRDDDRFYVASASGQFGALDPKTGVFTPIGSTTKMLSGLAIGPHNTIYGLDADNNLVTINPDTAATVVVGNIGLPVAADGNVTLFTSLGNGELFAIDPSNRLYSISPSTGQATLIGSTGIHVPKFDTCNCVTANSLTGAEGHLYFTFEVDDLASGKPITPSTLYRIDSHTGAATYIGATHAHAPIVGSGFIDDRFYGFTFGMPVGHPNQILAIDLETGAATLVANQASHLDPVFGAVPVTTRPAAVQLSLSASTATAIPGGIGHFTAFSPDPAIPPSPAVSAGRVAFVGQGTGGQAGVYTNFHCPGGCTIKVADLHTAIPGGIGNFTGFPAAPDISAGSVAFVGQGTGGQIGVYTNFQCPGGCFIRIADLHTAMPGGIGNFTAFPAAPVISDGNVAFAGQGVGGQAGLYTNFHCPGGCGIKVVDNFTAIPGGIGNFTGFPGGPVISGNNVAFVGQGTGGQIGVYTNFHCPGGCTIKVVDTNTAVPGALNADGFPSNAPFTSFANASISGTSVAFTGSYSNGSGVYTNFHCPGGCSIKVADTKTAVPGGVGAFTGFGAVVIDGGNIVFEGFSLDASFNPVAGIYRSVNGSLMKIVGTRDSLGGKSLSKVHLGPGGQSGNQVTFGAAFTDGSQAISLATIGTH